MGKTKQAQELSPSEIDSISGGGFWSDVWNYVTGGGEEKPDYTKWQATVVKG